jgi:hypothetical protein
MDKHAFESLAKFCASQRRAFFPDAWIERSIVDGKALAVAAMYLSMTGWYGYENELKSVAAKVETRLLSATGFHRELNSIEFDLGRFSARVRYEIATSEKRGSEAA